MRKTQFKSKNKSLSPKKLLLAMISLLIAFFLMITVIKTAKKYFNVRNHINEMTEEQNNLKDKYKKILQTNEYMASPEGAEQILRDKYNVVRPGEGVIIVVNNSEEYTPEETSKISKWWSDFMNFFLKKQ